MSVDDLAGQTVHVRQASSYYECLVALNAGRRAEGKSEAKLQLVPDALEDEDMTEMANAGLIDVLIVDDWTAKLWAQILPKPRIDERVFVREGGDVGWANHKARPKLAEIIRQFDSSGLRPGSSKAAASRQCTGRRNLENTRALLQRFGRNGNCCTV